MSGRGAKTDAGPKVAIIITAFNYETHIEGAVRSVLRQSHQNFEIVIVDDESAPASSARILQLVKSFNDERITLIRNEINIGQTLSFYAGVDHTTAEFVCLLDPDDRYLPDFLETMLAAHLNPIHIVPLVFSNQQFTRGDDSQLTGSHSKLLLQFFAANKMDELDSSLRRFGFSCFLPSTVRGWIWTSTSSMMFRRDALEMIRPRKTLAYKAFADTYLANGTHLLGGTLFVHTVLLSRSLHGQNAFNHARIFASNQNWGNMNLMGGNPKLDSAEALFESGSFKLMRKKELRNALLARLSLRDMFGLWRTSSAFRSSMDPFILMQSAWRQLLKSLFVTAR